MRNCNTDIHSEVAVIRKMRETNKALASAKRRKAPIDVIRRLAIDAQYWQAQFKRLPVYYQHQFERLRKAL